MLLAALACTSTYAQYREIKKKADDSFDQGKYFEAAFNYEKLTDSSKAVNLSIPTYISRNDNNKKISEDRPFIYYRLAESYRLYQNYHNAEKWYEKVLSNGFGADYPLTRLWYGICLRANEHFDASIAQLQQFIKAGFKSDAKFKAMADRELAASLLAKQQYAATTNTTTSKLNEAWNNEGGNYALIKNNGTFWLTSTSYSKTANKYLNNIYKDEAGNPLVPGKIVAAEGSSYTEFGTPSLNKAGNRMYFTAWNKNGSKASLAVCYSANFGNGWSVLRKLKNVNADGYNAMQPRVTDDGKRLYYASDKPGGQGGYDIWMSDLDADGNAINSVNLGNRVNSAYDEEAPFYDAAKSRLVYSSKGFTGIGGFDFFESFANGNQWLAPKNLGYPANSSKDDLYYFQDTDDAHKAYLSSDRASDCCLAVFVLNEKPIYIRGTVVACDSAGALTGVKVSLVDAGSGQSISSAQPGAGGAYDLTIYQRRNYQLKIEKEGFFTKTVTLNLTSNTDTLYSQQICLQGFVVKKPIVLNNILYDYNKADLRPEAKVALDNLVEILKDNPTLKIELAAHTDAIGPDAANLNLSQLRAQACVDYILASGISKDRLYAKGYGESKPVAPNTLPGGADNPAGRQLNRRTEFTILGK